MDFDGVKIALSDAFYWDHDFPQHFNQTYSHFKQIQFELQIKDVHETNLV